MELSWLEDFLALVDCANFSRAAERRHLTQPAFSRRIQALEAWIAAPLFDRAPNRVALTEAGRRFRPVAEELVRRLYQGREEARQADSMAAATLRFAATHVLSLTFFPAWLRSLETTARLGAIQLVSDSMQACEQLMLQPEAQFLLCHHHPAARGRLDPAQFRSLRLGDDVLLPVTAPSAPVNPVASPRFVLPGAAGAPVPHLAYSPESGLGRIVQAARLAEGRAAWLDPVFTSHLAAVLRTMAQDGRGIAWLPRSLVEDDLARGTLVRAGDGAWDIAVEIRLFRARSSLSPAAEAFWSRLTP